MRKSVTSVFLLVLLFSSIIYANSGSGNWPNWRGPDNTGAARTGNPPTKWSETENIKWKAKVPGDSLSTPIVWENKIIFLTAIEVEAGTAAANSNLIVTPVAFGRNSGRG
jgi:hypothetical protein